MNCQRACDLLDDYVDAQLSRYERQRLEAHLAACAACVEELRAFSAFEQAIGHALAASVQNRTLSTEASARIIRASQGGSRQAVWSSRALLTVRTTATLVTTALVVVSLLFLLERIPVSNAPRPVTLFPAIKLLLSELIPDTFSPADQPTLSEPKLVTHTPRDQHDITLDHSSLRIEPSILEPGEWFTITLELPSDLPRPAETARFDLEVSGPAGHYRFPMSVRGPLPAPGVSVVQITPDDLAAPCQKQYLISPTDMFKVPGIYTVRVTRYSPLLAEDR